MSVALHLFFALAWWGCLFVAAVLLGSATVCALAWVYDIRLTRQRARRDREQCERIAALRRQADWDWAMEPFRWEWAQREWLDDIHALPETAEREARL
jgi:hypothetical protein